MKFKKGLIYVLALAVVLSSAFWTLSQPECTNVRLLEGKYKLIYKDKVFYLEIKKNYLLDLQVKNIYTHQIISKTNGTWELQCNFLHTKIPPILNRMFGLGRVKKSLFYEKISIEAIWMGKFMGEEDSIYFQKLQE